MTVPLAVVHVPHASPAIPDAVRRTLLLTDEELRRELLLMTDWHTNVLFALPGDLASTVRFPVSRLVVDPERFIDDCSEPMADKGMGAVYTKTSDGKDLRGPLSGEERNALLSAYYYPHHARIRDAVGAALAEHGRCLIIDAHSFPSRPLPHEPDQSPGRCDICLGTDEYHSPTWLTELLTAAFARVVSLLPSIGRSPVRSSRWSFAGANPRYFR